MNNAHLDPPANCPQYIFQPRLFGLAQVVYSRNNIYMFPVGFSILDKFGLVAGKGFFKL